MATLDDADIPLKRRRMSGACDQCRKRKIKCDSATRPSQRCTNCIAFDTECTHSDPPKKRGPKSAYVEGLEDRVKELERLLRATSNHPSGSGPQVPPIPSASLTRPSPSSPPISTSSPSDGSLSHKSDDDEDLEHLDLSRNMERLSMYNTPRFFGSSSMFALAKATLKLKTSVLHDQGPKRGAPQYWYLQPWEQDTANQLSQQYIFPPHDLMMSLIGLFFEHVAPFVPVLHQPTFMNHVACADHLHHRQFGATVLLVLAIASRYSDDPRVLSDRYGSKLSAGWKYFEQVTLINTVVWDVVSLYELQSYTLSIIYSQGTSVPQTSWTNIAIGMRLALEIGVHRRKPMGYKMTAEDELMKRCFWCMLCLDRLISIMLGRPSLFREEDFDLELPVECDDQYWEIGRNGEVAFHQPPNLPSRMAFFSRHIKLCEILSFVSRTLYSIKKSQLTHGLTGKEWQQRIVTHLDGTMKSFLDELPDHLKFNHHRANTLFARQSVALYSLYYITMMFIHRPFVSTSQSSLESCTAAARSCSHVIETSPTPFFLVPVIGAAPFMSGIILGMSMWSGTGTGYEKEIGACLEALKAGSERWNPCGRFLGTLTEVVSGLDTVRKPTDQTNKRARENTPQVSYSSSSDTGSSSGQYSHSHSPEVWPPAEPVEPPQPGPLDNLGLDTNFMQSMDMWASPPPAYNLTSWGQHINEMSGVAPIPIPLPEGGYAGPLPYQQQQHRSTTY
ncbi:hypothetical protein CYLTODRAFT_456925 [Cylindrobasidium torrendii FP15055 ss-10]|uniref:Zn(2)-C6 fungal-type domain-containing protein n=1 Tax=Cylindrobasidium torrendii FP15055 ss-10 TaxID=1314674 RepID=A0A0D7B2M4_9AGAR|nr:hypothetical protein CYLTODRAFT_456925 [Cylindrobasidium torrendii FP15055 ss-10]